ncbi:MAG: PLP-dependent transferase [Caldilineaceae bacterium]|nr:PLP-dependent transferase [Caldilineaceae bacterium]
MTNSTNPIRAFATEAIHAGEIHDALGSHVAPIYQTSTFTFRDMEALDAFHAGAPDSYMYTRSKHPGRKALAQKLATLEGFNLIRQAQEAGQSGEGVVAGEIFSSGMAAVAAAILGVTSAGQHIIAQDVLYGSSEHLIAEVLSRFDISHSLLPGLQPEALEAALKRHPNTAAVYLETPANPTMTLIDILAVCEIAHAHGARVIVDNTFATPILQRPLEWGADVVVHSTTKYINGHGTVIGGAAITRDPQLLNERIWPMIRFMGGVPSPFDCWLTNLGLKTLPLRMKQHCANAMQVAHFLADHPKVTVVHYPGLDDFPQHALAQRQMDDFGAMLAFEVEGGYEGGRKLLSNVHLCSLAVSLGNIDTLIEHPASMTHKVVPPAERARQGITDGLIRLSVGLEEAADIVDDLAGALMAV